MKNNKKKNLKQMIALGSKTAKGGFTNEQDVIDRFNNWKTDKVAQEWLAEMSYKINDIECLVRWNCPEIKKIWYNGKK
jgi:hypothetical protein